MSLRRIALWGAAALVLVGAVVWSFWPDPVPVDIAEIRAAPMEVTVEAEGVSRIRDTFLVSAPISGTTTRSPVEVGDQVRMGETVVATIQPAAPGFLDARARLQAEAAVTEAEASVRLAEANVRRAEADLEYQQSQHERSRRLAAQGTIPQRMLDDALLQLRTQETAVEAARSELDRARATLERTRAQLVGPDTEAPPEQAQECCVEIRAPASGTVLSVENASARVVQAGAPLLTIGQPDDLEIEVDLLSADAVRVPPEAEARISRWGGEDELEARVRRIEPSGHTRVSTLGIEEQRVRVRLDLLTPPEARPGLGDGFRVFASIVLWRGEDVLQVPLGALFRHNGDWAVFRVLDDRAELTPVRLGRRTALVAEVTEGLSPGDRVVLHPGDRLEQGTLLVDRRSL